MQPCPFISEFIVPFSSEGSSFSVSCLYTVPFFTVLGDFFSLATTYSFSLPPLSQSSYLASAHFETPCPQRVSRSSALSSSSPGPQGVTYLHCLPVTLTQSFSALAHHKFLPLKFIVGLTGRGTEGPDAFTIKVQ